MPKGVDFPFLFFSFMRTGPAGAQVINEYGTDITDTALAAMPYTTAVLKETLRQKAIVSSVWRKTLVDIELGGYRIPKVGLGQNKTKDN